MPTRGELTSSSARERSMADSLSGELGGRELGVSGYRWLGDVGGAQCRPLAITWGGRIPLCWNHYHSSDLLIMKVESMGKFSLFR